MRYETFPKVIDDEESRNEGTIFKLILKFFTDQIINVIFIREIVYIGHILIDFRII